MKCVRENVPRSPYGRIRQRLGAPTELENWLERPMQWLGGKLDNQASAFSPCSKAREN